MLVLRLKEIMQEKEISREEISKALDVSMATISSISSGKVLPSIKFTMQLAEFLDVDIREMFNQTKGGIYTQNELKEATENIERGLDFIRKTIYNG
jgi:transcriptional regulator with XRE-family HTH domain